jgi:hypothetical protein
MPTSAVSSQRSTTSGTYGCWRTGSPIPASSGSPHPQAPRIRRLGSCGCGPASSRAGSGRKPTEGRSKGAGISPLLANIVLHDVLDPRSRQSLGPAMATAAGARSCRDRALRRRFRHRIPEGGGRASDAVRARRALGRIRPHAARAEDPADRVWPHSGDRSKPPERAAARDLCLPRVHPLLRVDKGTAGSSSSTRQRASA